MHPSRRDGLIQAANPPIIIYMHNLRRPCQMAHYKKYPREIGLIPTYNKHPGVPLWQMFALFPESSLIPRLHVIDVVFYILSGRTVFSRPGSCSPSSSGTALPVGWFFDRGRKNGSAVYSFRLAITNSNGFWQGDVKGKFLRSREHGKNGRLLSRFDWMNNSG